MTVLWYIERMIPAVASLVVAIAAAFGVRQYRLAAQAEARMRDSATIENEIKAAQQLDSFIRNAEGFDSKGPISIGLATQRATFRSIVRLVALYPSLKDAALAGLRTLREAASMEKNHPQLDTAIKDVTAVRDKPTSERS